MSKNRDKRAEFAGSVALFVVILVLTVALGHWTDVSFVVRSIIIVLAGVISAVVVHTLVRQPWKKKASPED